MELHFPVKFKTKDKIILAFSGGSDSVFLLYQLLEYQKNFPQKTPQIILAHLNHNLRGKESFSDQNFTKKLAEKLKIKLVTKTLAKQKSQTTGNLEEKMRIERYKFLEETRRRHNAKLILTAHHLNDQLETFLFNLGRGALVSGLNGINQYDSNKKIYRPLLNISKSEILHFLKKRQLKFCNDSSNKNLKFSRNYIRHQIIPHFEKLNSAFLKTFNSTHQNLTKNLELITHFAEQWIKKNLKTEKKSKPHKLFFRLDHLLDQPVHFQKIILQSLYKKFNSKGILKGQIEEILKTFSQDKSNRQKEFGEKNLLIKKHSKTQKRIVEILPAKS